MKALLRLYSAHLNQPSRREHQLLDYIMLLLATLRY